VDSGEPVSARQTIPILVKYSRMMNNFFAEIQKMVPPGGTPRRVHYQGPPGSPTGTLYEEVGGCMVEWTSFCVIAYFTVYPRALQTTLHTIPRSY
jgi:hypothetical protein